jgi:dipeptidyl aminopeptidase/acylaminoacyl peptidase
VPDTNSTPLWEQRFHAPTQTFPHWATAAPERVVYTSDEGGSFQAYALDRSTGRTQRLSNEPVGVDQATVSGDGAEAIWFADPTGDESGRWVAFPIDGGDPRDLFPGAPIGWPEGLAVGRQIAVGVIADRSGFALYAAERGGPAWEILRDPDRVAISASDYHLEGVDRAGLSADEAMVAVDVAQDGDNIHCAVRVLDARTGDVVGHLADGPGFGLSAYAWSPIPGDERLLVGHERDDHLRPAIWDPVSGDRTDLALDLPGEAMPIDWWPDASAVLLSHRFRGRDRLYRLDLSSRALTELPHQAGEILGARVRPDGEVWMRLASGDRASRLLDDRGVPVLEPAVGGVREGRPYREWLFRNPAGDTILGWLVQPDGEGPFPTYLKVHGGPDWLYMDTWFPDVQLLVDHGFAVAMVNYRGSIGFGRSFRDHIIGNIGFPEVEDVVAGLDDLIARGIADPERAVIGGWSWGGYITLLALGTRPERFVAGVGGVPVGDYAGSYDESAPSLQAYDRSLIGGVVHDLPEFVAERSPITYVDRVKAPVLVLVGENDTRCVPAQVYSYVDALRGAGGDVDVYSYDEGHSTYVVDEEVREWRTVLNFLTRYVPGLQSPPVT